MGKTGSSSIYYTLMREFPYNKVLHAHFLSDFWYSWFQKQSGNSSKKTRNQRLSSLAKKYIKTKNKVIIISIIRDPFSRSISDYFHSNKNNVLNKTDTQIKKEILNSFYIQSNSIDWFEKDFNSFFQIDIFGLPFDTAKGYHIYNLNDKYQLLLIRLDVLTKSFREAFYSLTGISISNLFVTNRREDDKKLANRYKVFKENYTEDIDSVNKKLNSKFIRHFFTYSQIENFKNIYLHNK